MSTIIPKANNVTVILSAELDWRDDCRNGLDHLELRARLARQLEIGELLTVAECRGAYKGTPERSIAITGPAGRTLAIGQSEGERFRQESILVVNEHGGGCLRFIDRLNGGDDEPIGHYRQIPTSYGRDAYTTVLATGETFFFE